MTHQSTNLYFKGQKDVDSARCVYPYNYCYVLAQAACYYLLQIRLAVLNEMFSNKKKKREKIEKKVR